MSKFGELIDLKIPVLLDFYTAWSADSTAMHPVMKEVANAIGAKGKVIKIDVDKNNELADALRIKSLPTLIIYKNGEMLWRQSGSHNASTLIDVMEEYMS